MDDHEDKEKSRIAKEDADGVESSDALVLVAGPDRYSGGKFVEVGIALGMRKLVVVIGRRENMLLWHPSVMATDDPRLVDGLLVAARSNFR